MTAGGQRDLRAKLGKVQGALNRAQREQTAVMNAMREGQTADFSALQDKTAKVDALQGQWVGTAAQLVARRKKAP